jgi:hypothetical protein
VMTPTLGLMQHVRKLALFGLLTLTACSASVVSPDASGGPRYIYGCDCYGCTTFGDGGACLGMGRRVYEINVCPLGSASVQEACDEDCGRSGTDCRNVAGAQPDPPQLCSLPMPGVDS